jgi:4-hydroxybenzoyl-CoA reductase subunit beta
MVSANATRQVDASDLYQNDGIHYLTRRPDEILTAVHIPPMDGWRSVYWKLRRRGSFDFPVLSVAAAAKLAADGTVEAARIILGAVASRPIDAAAAAVAVIGQRLTDDVIAQAADAAAKPAKPMDNTDFDLTWRKRVMKDVVTYALRELRGDDMRDWRRRLSRMIL